MSGTVCRDERREHSPLYALRLRRGWSVEELASRAGVSARTIYNAEVGDRQPHRATRQVLAMVLGCEPDALLNKSSPTVATAGSTKTTTDVEDRRGFEA